MKKSQKYEQEIIALQNKIRSLLASFYTGAGMSGMNKIFYPYFYLCQNDTKRGIKEIASLVSQVGAIKEAEPVLKKNSELEKKAISCSQDIGEFLSLYFSFLKQLQKKYTKKDKEVKIPIPSIDISHYPPQDTEYISVLNNLQKTGERLRKEKKGTLLLFGSLATRDYVKGHSDLDTAFIISEEACLNPEILLSLRKDIAEIMKESFFIDPLQHHGPYIFTVFDLKMFPQYYLPFVVFENTVSLSGEMTLSFYERDSKDECTELLQRYKETFVRIVNTPREKLPKSRYAKKFLYQAILLFPSVYLQAKGKPCYKRDSFSEIRKYLDENGKALLDALSEAWGNNIFGTAPAGINMQKIMRFIQHPFVYPSLYRTFFYTKEKKLIDEKIKIRLQDGLKNYMSLIDKERKELR